MQNDLLNYVGKVTSNWAGHSYFTCLGQTTGAKCAWKVLLRSVIGIPWSIGGNSSISINLKNYVTFIFKIHTLNAKNLAMVWAGWRDRVGKETNYIANQPKCH